MFNVKIVTVLIWVSLFFVACGDDRANRSDKNATKQGVLGVVEVIVDDSDGDGISDEDEINIYGTNPNSNDTDSDGLLDGEEINIYDTNVTNPDTDGDGLSDGEEIHTYETNASNPDSDNDGLNDEVEVHTYRTNPINPDTDGDCLLDGFEILYYETNATNVDTDGDTVNDGIEVYANVGDELNISCLITPETLANGYNHNPARDGIPTPSSDVINALDPTNDSDGDGQANVRENNCTEGDPMDKDKICPFVNETDKGATLLAYGYVYVPGGFDVDGDGVKEGGFWMSRYQARSSGIVIPSETVIDIVGNINQYISKEFMVLNLNIQVLSYFERALTETEITAGTELLFKETDIAGLNRISNYTPLLAQVCLSQYHLVDSNGTNLDINITMPTMKQYVQVKKLLDADFASSGDGRHIRNGLLGIDPNVPLTTFSLVIEEFGSKAKEFVRNLAQLRDINGNDSFLYEKDIHICTH